MGTQIRPSRRRIFFWACRFDGCQASNTTEVAPGVKGGEIIAPRCVRCGREQQVVVLPFGIRTDRRRRARP